MTKNDYWRKREQEHIKKMIKNDKAIAKRLKANQLRAMNETQQQIEAFYGRYATAEGLTMAEARSRVAQVDINKYSEKAKRYVKEKNFSKRANAEMRLYNATMRINQLELLKANISLELVAMANTEEWILFEEFTKGAKAEFTRQSGILGQSMKYNEKNIGSIVNASFLTATWSDRLWDNMDALRSELERLLNRGIVQGVNPRVLARELRKKFDTSIANSERLMRTEMARVQGQVQMDSYEQMEYEAYEYIAEPTACDICAELDGKIFSLSDMKIGVNFYPMHPHCMCSSAASFDRAAWDADLKARGL